MNEDAKRFNPRLVSERPLHWRRTASFAICLVGDDFVDGRETNQQVDDCHNNRPRTKNHFYYVKAKRRQSQVQTSHNEKNEGNYV